MKNFFILVFILFLSQFFIYPCEANGYNFFQIFPVNEERVIKEIKKTLSLLEIEILGLDSKTGIVATKPKTISLSEVPGFQSFSSDSESFYYILIIFIQTNTNNPNQTRVWINTILQEKDFNHSPTESGCLTSGNFITQEILNALEKSIGPGLSTPIM